jgi:hypothetical protein
MKFKTLIILVLGIFLIALVSSATINDIKDYDEDTKTALIKDSSLGDIKQELVLRTKQIEAVGLGYQKVAEFEITNYEDIEYDKVVKSIEAYDIKGDKLIKKTKTFDLKYQIEVIDERPVYETINVQDVNGTWYTEQNLTGYEEYTYYAWEDFDSNKLLAGQTITMGIFTTTYEGEYAEWIPTFKLGKDYTVDEWASWSASLTTGLRLYVGLNESSGTTAIDYMNNFNGTYLNTPTLAVSGKYQNAIGLDAGSSEAVNFTTTTGNSLVFSSGEFTLSFWVNVTGTTAGEHLIGKIGPAGESYNGFMVNRVASNKLSIYQANSGSAVFTSTNVINGSIWKHVVLKKEGTNLSLWINGTYDSSATSTGSSNTTNPFRIGPNPTWGNYPTARFDEVALFNRSLSQTEIETLWDSGTGTFCPTFNCNTDSAPNVTLNLPVNTSNLTVSNYNFNGTVFDGINLTNVSFKLDGVIISTNTSGLNNSLYNFYYTGLTNGQHNWSLLAYDNSSQSTESTRTFNVSVTAPIVTLQSPVDVYNSSSQSNTFIAFVTSPDTLVNVSLVQNGTTMTATTNTSGINNTNYTFTGNFPDGTHTWNVIACDVQNDCGSGTIRTIRVDTVDPSVTLSSPVSQGYFSIPVTQGLYLNWSASDTNLDSCWYEYNSTATLLLNTTTLPSSWFDGNYTTGNTQTSVGNYTFSLKNQSSNYLTISDIFNHINGTTTYNKYYLNTTSCSIAGNERVLYLNVTSLGGTARQLNFSCGSTVLQTINTGGVGSQRNIAELDTIREYVSCSLGNNYFMNNPYASNITFYSNDTFGNEGNASINWSIEVTELSVSYNSNATSGSTQPFGVTYYFRNSPIGMATKLNYNNTNYTMSTSNSSYTRDYTVSLTTPSVVANQNLTFYFIPTITNSSGSFSFSSSSFNQTIFPFNIGNCTAYNNTLLNMSMKNEYGFAEINGTIEIEANIYSYVDRVLVNTFNASHSYVAGTPYKICVGDLDGSYSLDYTIKHYADGYFKKYRNIQNFTLDEGSLFQNITLYNLNESLGYAFDVIVVGNIFTPSVNDGLLVEIQKQYLSLAQFILVESPITSSSDVGVGNLVPSDEIYNFVVSYQGETLGTFNNYQVKCQNPSINQCSITLNLASATGTIADFQESGNVTFVYLIDDSILYTTFSATDGESHTLNQTLYKDDGFGNVSICSVLTAGTSGTINCAIPAIYQNTSFYSVILIDDETYESKFFSQGSEPDLSGVAIFIELLMLSSLVLLMIAHPATIIIGGILGLTLPILLLYLGTGMFASMLGAISYYIIAGIIALISIGRKL